MQSGGFSPSSKVPKINSPALVLWGRQDGILDGTEFANKVRRHVSRDTKIIVLKFRNDLAASSSSEIIALFSPPCACFDLCLSSILSDLMLSFLFVDYIYIVSKNQSAASLVCRRASRCRAEMDRGMRARSAPRTARGDGVDNSELFDFRKGCQGHRHC